MHLALSFAFCICFGMLTSASGNRGVGVLPINDVRRQKVRPVAPDGTTSINGLYTLVNPATRWPGGVLPWAFHPNNTFTTDDKATIVEAINILMSKTCIQFVNRTNQIAYVDIKNDADGCFAGYGYYGNPVSLNLGTGCVYSNVIIHELMHVLGFDHEQSRYDRDLYVRVQWQNINPNYTGAFDKYPRTLSYPKDDFDFSSLMMYSLGAFSINSSPAMIVLRNPTGIPENEIGEAANMSLTDVHRIRSAYKCPT